MSISTSEFDQKIPDVEKRFASFWKDLPWHLLIALLFPVVFLIIGNRVEFWGYGPRLLGMTAPLLIVTVLVLSLALWSFQKGALIVTVFSMLCFVLGLRSIPPQELSNNDLLLVIQYCSPFIAQNYFSWGTFIPLIIGGILVFWIKKPALKGITIFLNAGAAVLFLFGGYNLVQSEIDVAIDKGIVQARGERERDLFAALKERIKSILPRDAGNEQTPDIYLISTDGFTGQMMTKDGPYDIGDFVDFLKQNGFEVPKKCMSNYSLTMFSVGSMLNMQYLHERCPELCIRNEQGNVVIDHNMALVNFISSNKVMDRLRREGYDIYHDLFNWSHLMVNYENHDNITRYKNSVRNTTNAFLEAIPAHEFDAHINRLQGSAIFDSFERMKLIASKPSSTPRFVMTHIGAPHTPYIFKADGTYNSEYSLPASFSDREIERVSRSYYSYRRFIADRLKELVASILANSETEPIIVIVSDHAQEHHIKPIYDGESHPLARLNLETPYYVVRNANFIAIHLPERYRGSVPEDMTNVNIFRYIFHQVFGDDFLFLTNQYFCQNKNDGKVPKLGVEERAPWYYTYVNMTEDVEDYLRKFDVAEKATREEKAQANLESSVVP